MKGSRSGWFYDKVEEHQSHVGQLSKQERPENELAIFVGYTVKSWSQGHTFRFQEEEWRKGKTLAP